MPNERDFAEYVESLSKVLGHADRTAPLEGYCRGLMLTSERKSVEPMAALVDPAAVSARHQSMHHFVAASEWSDEKFLAQVRELVLPKLGPIEAWIVDDTGYPKKGNHSVGVARQYCGQLGKQDNCQVAVSVSVANEAASLPIAYQLYLPQEWADDKARRRKAGVPEQIGFATKNQIALAQLRAAREANIPPGVVLADAGYGNDADFRGGVAELGLCYAVGIQSKTTVWTSENRPLPPKKGGKGRPGTLWQRDAEHRPTDVKTLAYTLFARHWKNITWREGERGALRSRFARVRVRAAHRNEVRPEEWLVIEWPLAETEPIKYWLSNLPETTPFKQMIRLIKLRWRIERDYQELKQEMGLGHYEGRNWRGFHHHASLCIASYAFLMRCRLSEKRRGKKNSAQSSPELRAPRRPRNFKPRGAAGTN